MSIPPNPSVVECPDCGRMVRAVRGRFMEHSQCPTGPRCRSSRGPVTEEALKATRLRRLGEQVLLWAHTLRDEDPRRVHSWVQHAHRAELETLMLLALAAIPDDMTPQRAYGWVNDEKECAR